MRFSRRKETEVPDVVLFNEMPDVLTVAETARLIRLTENTVYGLVHSGELAATRVGRRILVTKAAVLVFLGVSAPTAG
jgi:excisionase family DNA binding protein